MCRSSHWLRLHRIVYIMFTPYRDWPRFRHLTRTSAFDSPAARRRRLPAARGQRIGAQAVLQHQRFALRQGRNAPLGVDLLEGEVKRVLGREWCQRQSSGKVKERQRRTSGEGPDQGRPRRWCFHELLSSETHPQETREKKKTQKSSFKVLEHGRVEQRPKKET